MEQIVTAVLRDVEIFRGLPDGAIATVARTAIRQAFPAGSTIFRQDEEASTAYVVLAGRVKLVQLTAEGHQVVLRMAGPGQFIAAVAVLGGQRYPATAEALTETEVLAWEGDAMARIMEDHPRIALNAIRHLSGRLREIQDRYRELATERVERRVARAVLRLARQAGRAEGNKVVIDIPISKEDLAQWTGTTLFTVSRIISEWAGRGLVETGRERLTILQTAGLARIADDLPERLAPDSPS